MTHSLELLLFTCRRLFCGLPGSVCSCHSLACCRHASDRSSDSNLSHVCRLCSSIFPRWRPCTPTPAPFSFPLFPLLASLSLWQPPPLLGLIRAPLQVRWSWLDKNFFFSSQFIALARKASSTKFVRNWILAFPDKMDSPKSTETKNVDCLEGVIPGHDLVNRALQGQHGHLEVEQGFEFRLVRIFPGIRHRPLREHHDWLWVGFVNFCPHFWVKRSPKPIETTS